MTHAKACSTLVAPLLLSLGCGSSSRPTDDAQAPKDAAAESSKDSGMDAAKDARDDGGDHAETGKPDDAGGVHEGGVAPPPPCAALAATVMCTGDGVTDDTACLEAALAAGAANVVLPKGKTYLISSPLKLPADTALVGNGSTILSQGTAMLTIGGSSASVCGVSFVQKGTAENAPVVNVTAGVQNIAFRNNSLTSTSAPIGFYIAPGGPTGHVLVQGNTFTGTTFPVLLNATGQGQTLSNYQHDITIDQNTITGAGADGIEINSPVQTGSGKPGIAANAITITNNQISNQSEFGIGLAGVVQALVSGNVIDNTGVPPGSTTLIEGIHVEDHATNITIVGNTITNTMGTTIDDSAITLLNSNHVYIYDNVIEATTAGSGVELSYDPKGDYDSDCIIAGNQISSSGNYGVFVGGLSGEPVDTLIGPSGAFGGNVTKGSALPGNQGGKGSIQAVSGDGIVVTGNSGD